MTIPLTGTVALVTGTSSGIGEVTALVAPRQDRLEALAAKINEAGGTALAMSADITDRAQAQAQAQAAVQAVAQHFGRMDILVNNASLMLLGAVVGADGRPQGQYGSGRKMQGKQFMLSLTMNAPREAFDDPAQRLFSGRWNDEVFFSASAPYRFCGVEILPAFGSFDVMKAPQISSNMDRLKQRLVSL